jgi:hypothetical protein
MHRALNKIAETSGDFVGFLDAVGNFCKRRINSFRDLRVLVDRAYPTYCYAQDGDGLLLDLFVPWHSVAGRCIKDGKRIISVDTAEAANDGVTCVMAEPLRYFNEFFGCAVFLLAEEPGPHELEILEAAATCIAPAVYFLHRRAENFSEFEDHDISETAALAARKTALLFELNGKSVSVSEELEAGLGVFCDERAILDGVFLNIVKNIWSERERRGLDNASINIRTYDDGGRAVVEIRDISGGVDNTSRPSGEPRPGEGHGASMWMDTAREVIGRHGWSIERDDAEGVGTAYYIKTSASRAWSQIGSQIGSSAVDAGSATPYDRLKVDSGDVTVTYAGFKHDGAIIEAAMWGVRGVFGMKTPDFPLVAEEVLVDIDFGGGRGVSGIGAVVIRVEEARQEESDGRSIVVILKFIGSSAREKRKLLWKTFTEHAAQPVGMSSEQKPAKRKYYRLKVEGGGVSVNFGGNTITGAVIEAGMGGMLGMFEIGSRFPRVSEKVLVDIDFKGGQRVLGVEAAVVRIEAAAEPGARASVRYVRAAMRFTGTDDSGWKTPLWNALIRQIVVLKESTHTVAI